MGDAVEIVNETKNSDKQQIEDEENEEMLKEAAQPLDPSEEILKPSKIKTERETKPKFIPIGGIKMPGFITRVIETEPKGIPNDPESSKDPEIYTDNPSRMRRLFSNCRMKSFPWQNSGKENNSSDIHREETTNRYNLDGIHSSLTKIFRKNVQTEVSMASVETLDDNLDGVVDGMETIKLEAKDEPHTNDKCIQPKLPWKERFRQKQFIIDDLVVAIAVFVIVMAIVIAVLLSLALSGPPMERPLRDGKFMAAVTSCGEVEGVLEEGAYKFYGIPYAVPPIGPKRFTKAEQHSIASCWNGTRLAHSPAPPCVQMLENGTIVGEEDCLTLDIVTPKVRYDYPNAVVVFIDANSLNGGIGPTHLSSKYAHLKDVVFVKPNFRLGALGFLALNILSQETYPPTSGNYGISDLIMALNWIQDNIHHFGGDSSKVTIYGHRAGATLASVITSMKSARKLYRAAWLVSGSISFNASTLQDIEHMNEKYLLNTLCLNTSCLRNLPAEAVVRATPPEWNTHLGMDLPKLNETQHSWIVIDGDLVRLDPLQGWEEERKRSEVRSKPLVFVTTEHAAHSETLYKRHLNWSEMEVEEDFNSSALAPAHELLYQFGRNYSGLVAMISSVRITCPLLYVARIRLDLPMIVIKSVEGLSDVNADVSAILGTVDTPLPAHRRHVAAVQDFFYNLVWDGNLTAPSHIITIEQDALSVQSLTGCDVMFQKDLAPRYGIVD